MGAGSSPVALVSRKQYLLVFVCLANLANQITRKVLPGARIVERWASVSCVKLICIWRLSDESARNGSPMVGAVPGGSRGCSG